MCLSLTCYPGNRSIWGWFRRWLRSSSGWRRLRVWRTQLCLCEPLHHRIVLGVTVPAAALLFPTVLGHHKVVAAVVTEDATTKPKKWSKVWKNKWGAIHITPVILFLKHIFDGFWESPSAHWKLTCNDVCAATRWTGPGSRGSAWPPYPLTTSVPLLAVSAQTQGRLTSATKHLCPWYKAKEGHMHGGLLSFCAVLSNLSLGLNLKV